MYTKYSGFASFLGIVIIGAGYTSKSDSASTRNLNIMKTPESHLAAFPSPDEDGTFYVVNLSDPPTKLGKINQSEEDVRFYLYTIRTSRNDLKTEEIVHEIKIGESNPPWLSFFYPNSTLRILCHGYKSSHEKPFPSEMKTLSLLGNSVNVNVVLMGWETLAKSDFYKEAINNLQYVGEKTAQMLNYVYRFSVLDLKRVHFIGHNLGAHIGGYLGHSIQMKNSVKLGRITGLDPAGVENCDPQNILDPSDAEFVEAIHTDDGNHCWDSWIPMSRKEDFVFRNWGIGGRVGHLDVYVKIRTNESPSLKSKSLESYSCGHCRSYKWMMELMAKNPDPGTENLNLCNCESSESTECQC